MQAGAGHRKTSDASGQKPRERVEKRGAVQFGVNAACGAQIHRSAQGDGNTAGDRDAENPKARTERDAQNDVADNGKAAVDHGVFGVLMTVEVAAIYFTKDKRGEHQGIATQRLSADADALCIKGAAGIDDGDDVL